MVKKALSACLCKYMSVFERNKRTSWQSSNTIKNIRIKIRIFSEILNFCVMPIYLLFKRKNRVRVSTCAFYLQHCQQVFSASRLNWLFFLATNCQELKDNQETRPCDKLSQMDWPYTVDIGSYLVFLYFTRYLSSNSVENAILFPLQLFWVSASLT